MSVELTHSPAEILAVALIAEGVVTTPTGLVTDLWPLHIAEEPDRPDDCLTVYDTVGQQDGSSMHGGYLWEQQGFQLRVRASTHRIGWKKADQLRTTLAQSVYFENVTIEAKTYVLYCAGDVGPILALGKESQTSTRRIFTINGRLSIRATN